MEGSSESNLPVDGVLLPHRKAFIQHFEEALLDPGMQILPFPGNDRVKFTTL